MKDPKVFLSTLWIFVTLNYIYADVFGLYDPHILKQVLTGSIGSVSISQNFLLAGSLLMEIPIAMVVLSRWLNYKANRMTNLVAAIIKTLVVFLSLFVDSPTIYYIFFSVIEMSCTLFIFWYALRWKGDTNQEA